MLGLFKKVRTAVVVSLISSALLCFGGLVLAQETDQKEIGASAVFQEYAQSGDTKNMVALASSLLPIEKGSLNWVSIACGAIFGTIGFVGFLYGKNNRLWRPAVIGIGLMVFPYFFSSTVSVILVGLALTAALYVWRS